MTFLLEYFNANDIIPAHSSNPVHMQKGFFTCCFPLKNRTFFRRAYDHKMLANIC
jgi:hypothetical protein